MADDFRRTDMMNDDERSQLEAQIAAENPKGTIYQTPSSSQNYNSHLFDNEPLPHYPDVSEMSALDKVDAYSWMLEQIDTWTHLDLSERGIITHRANLHYLRGLVKEEAGNLAGAQSDFTEAARINPDDQLYGKEAKRLLRSCMINSVE